MQPESATTTVTHKESEHVRVLTTRPCPEVMRRLQAATGVFDLAQVQDQIAEGAPAEAVVDAIAAMAGRSGFMRFWSADHGAVLGLRGQPTQAVRFLIG